VNVSVDEETPSAAAAVEAVVAADDVEGAEGSKVRDWKDLPDDMPEYSDTDSDEGEEEGGEEKGEKKKKSDKDGKDVSEMNT
jgi:hypothetical protein